MLKNGRANEKSCLKLRPLILATCAFRREHVPAESLVQIEVAGYSASICENCLTILIVHRRYHHLNLEKLILQISME